MPIHSGDVKLLQSAVMSDAPEGGGALSGNAIADGASNAIFPDISELDRAGGRVALRKVFARVDTPDADTYFGANVIVAEPPKDPRVSVTLFKADAFDKRDAARTRIEAYLSRGGQWGGFLFENHIAGQRAIQLFQRPGAQLPSVGQTLVLVQSEGLQSQFEQYVRITRVSSVLRTYTYDADKDYQAAIVTCDISDALRNGFTGSPPDRRFERAGGAAVVRDTLVADAGAYAGVVPLAQDAQLGDFSARCASIFTQLVPSAQAETPMAALPPHAAAALPVAGGPAVTYQADYAWSSSSDLLLPGGCLPGSLAIDAAGLRITDDGARLRTLQGEIGTIDYANGVLRLASGAIAGAKTITYRPAARLLRAPQSMSFEVTVAERRSTYTGQHLPLPQPGTLVVSYRAQGRWYMLQDAGGGKLAGLDASIGAGTVQADTGAFVVTLGALPDVGSSVVLQWGGATQEIALPARTLRVSQQLQLAPADGAGVDPLQCSFSWQLDGVAKTAVASKSGKLSGDASGQISLADGRVSFSPHQLPAPGATISVSYAPIAYLFTPPFEQSGAQWQASVPGGNIIPGSVYFHVKRVPDMPAYLLALQGAADAMGIKIDAAAHTTSSRVSDNGAGGLIDEAGRSCGSVDYASGAIVFLPAVGGVMRLAVPDWTPGGGFASAGGMGGASSARVKIIEGVPCVESPSGGAVFATGNAGLAQTQTFTWAPEIDMGAGAIVPGSLLLQADGALWGDAGAGQLAAVQAGARLAYANVSYLDGRVQLLRWRTGMSADVQRVAGLQSLGESIGATYVFRTAGAPLRPGSLSIQFARSTGGVQNVQANAAGVIAADGVLGMVDHESGLVRLYFGRMVTAAAGQGQPWFDASNVGSDGMVWRPEPVATSTLRYSAVAYSYLPLDASILGLDPVRLPSDGRVPILRAGGFAVLGHTGRLTASVSNGQTLNCARVRLSRLRVLGADGAAIHTGYTTDLEAGTVTFTSTAGYSQPVTIEHRIEDMVVLRDVQITGEVSFTRPLSHSYPAQESYLSSALVAGDIYARVSHLFDQQTWTAQWADAPIGADALASYNAAQYPVRVTNAGAVTERWLIRFTNSTAFEVIGEHVGQIATGSTAADCAPLNPATGAPYFVIPALGWGGGWAAGNCLRLNTVGADVPLWCVRTVQQGPEGVASDSFTLLVRGDVDANP
jgi:hypothetical protein